MLSEKINENLINALKSGDAFSVEVLRSLNAAFKNKSIDKRGRGEKEELTDEEVVDIVNKELKKRREAAGLFARGRRNDLAEKENREAEILVKYLPEQLSMEEVEKMVDEVIAGGASDLGGVMRVLKDKIRGRADGRMVAEVIKKKLPA